MVQRLQPWGSPRIPEGSYRRGLLGSRATVKLLTYLLELQSVVQEQRVAGPRAPQF